MFFEQPDHLNRWVATNNLIKEKLNTNVKYKIRFMKI